MDGFYWALQMQSHSWREVVAAKKKEDLYDDIPSLSPVNDSWAWEDFMKITF